MQINMKLTLRGEEKWQIIHSFSFHKNMFLLN